MAGDDVAAAKAKAAELEKDTAQDLHTPPRAQLSDGDGGMTSRVPRTMARFEPHEGGRRGRRIGERRQCCWWPASCRAGWFARRRTRGSRMWSQVECGAVLSFPREEERRRMETRKEDKVGPVRTHVA
jgi:hypothetical protein